MKVSTDGLVVVGGVVPATVLAHMHEMFVEHRLLRFVSTYCSLYYREVFGGDVSTAQVAAWLGASPEQL